MTAERTNPEDHEREDGQDQSPESSRFEKNRAALEKIKAQLPPAQESTETPEQHLITTEDAGSETVTGEVMADDPTARAQETRIKVLQGRHLLRNLIRGAEDPETRALVKDILEERLQREAIRERSKTDARLMEELSDQAKLINSALTGIKGEPTNMIQLYEEESHKNPDKYPPLETYAGYVGLIRFHHELSTELFSAPTIATAQASAKAESAVLVLRKGVNVIRIQSDREVADEYVRSAESFKEAATARAEVRSAQIRGVTRTIATAGGEAPITFFKTIQTSMENWVKGSEDPVASVAFLSGIFAGPSFLLIKGAEMSPIIYGWVTAGGWSTVATLTGSAAAGAVLLYGGWKLTRFAAEFVWDVISNTYEAIANKINDTLESIGRKMDEMKRNRNNRD